MEEERSEVLCSRHAVAIIPLNSQQLELPGQDQASQIPAEMGENLMKGCGSDTARVYVDIYGLCYHRGTRRWP